MEEYNTFEENNPFVVPVEPVGEWTRLNPQIISEIDKLSEEQGFFGKLMDCIVIDEDIFDTRIRTYLIQMAINSLVNNISFPQVIYVHKFEEALLPDNQNQIRNILTFHKYLGSTDDQYYKAIDMLIEESNKLFEYCGLDPLYYPDSDVS